MTGETEKAGFSMLSKQSFESLRMGAHCVSRVQPSSRTLILLLALSSAPTLSMSQTAPIEGTQTGSVSASEERVKAAFLYKFLNYVDWPAIAFSNPDMPYVIGVFGADDIADELVKISAGRTLNNRKVTVKKIQSTDAADGLHVLFIGRSERRRQIQLLNQSHTQPVLLVTETEGALAHGSMINFRIVDDRVRFEVALAPVEKTGLRLSSRILSVAMSVVKGSPQ